MTRSRARFAKMFLGLLGVGSSNNGKILTQRPDRQADVNVIRIVRKTGHQTGGVLKIRLLQNAGFGRVAHNKGNAHLFDFVSKRFRILVHGDDRDAGLIQLAHHFPADPAAPADDMMPLEALDHLASPFRLENVSNFAFDEIGNQFGSCVGKSSDASHDQNQGEDSPPLRHVMDFLESTVDNVIRGHINRVEEAPLLEQGIPAVPLRSG
jgi:hypothetical protein